MHIYHTIPAFFDYVLLQTLYVLLFSAAMGSGEIACSFSILPFAKISYSCLDGRWNLQNVSSYSNLHDIKTHTKTNRLYVLITFIHVSKPMICTEVMKKNNHKCVVYMHQNCSQKFVKNVPVI